MTAEREVALAAKVCRCCDVEKLPSEFYRSKRNSDGLYSYCKPCAEAMTAESRRRNPPKRSRRPDTRRGSHQSAEYFRAYRAADPSRTKARDRRLAIQKHGITVAEFEQLLANQGGHCAICPAVMSRLYIDHDHEHCPGGWGCRSCVRGLLCPSCNRKEAHLGDVWREYLARPRPFATSSAN